MFCEITQDGCGGSRVLSFAHESLIGWRYPCCCLSAEGWGWSKCLVQAGIAFIFPFKNFILFIFYFWLNWVFIAARELCLGAASRGYSLVVVRGLLTAVASPVVGHRL